MRYYLLLTSIFWMFGLHAQIKKEMKLLVDVSDLKNQTGYQLMYTKIVNKSDIALRFGTTLFIDTDKETRYDTFNSSHGTITYNLSLGLQKQLKLANNPKVKLYAGMDGYWHSTLNKKTYESYYGYYWNVGFQPLFGLYFDPNKNVRLSVESRSKFNLNFQEYSAPGDNMDQRIDFRSVDQVMFGIGYLF